MRPLSSARKGFLAIAGASGAAQLVGLAGMPVISRLFSPEEFGPFAVVNAAVLPAAALASLRLELAIPLPDEGQARALVSLGLRASAWFGLVGTVIAGLVVTGAGAWTDDGWWSLLPWVPVVAGLMGAFAVLNQYAVRHRAYGAIGRRNVLMAVAVVSLQVTAGLLDAGPHGLAAGLAGGQLVGVLSLRHSLRGQLRAVSAPTRAERAATLGSHRTYPLLMAPAGVVNVLGLTAPLLLVAAIFGQTVSGWLGMTQRVLTLPVALLGLALAQVYLGEFSAARREGGRDLERLFLRTSMRLGLAALAMVLVVGLASPIAFPLVLGEQWERSGTYGVALAAAMGVQMVASPLSQTVIVMGYPALQAMWDVLRLVACGGAVLVSHRLGLEDVATVGVLGGTMCLTYVLSWLLSFWAVRSGPRARDVTSEST
ncbi:lipopolysaccharide biosynthesis protein [Knoellia locipacati]|uniref:lipopolysaccharide biosynthesis protein n=1 Tax=Knoellia locipacati TaxID=882824 RepID=UPI00385131BE